MSTAPPLILYAVFSEEEGCHVQSNHQILMTSESRRSQDRSCASSLNVWVISANEIDAFVHTHTHLLNLL